MIPTANFKSVPRPKVLEIGGIVKNGDLMGSIGILSTDILWHNPTFESSDPTGMNCAVWTGCQSTSGRVASTPGDNSGSPLNLTTRFFVLNWCFLCKMPESGSEALFNVMYFSSC